MNARLLSLALVLGTVVQAQEDCRLCHDAADFTAITDPATRPHYETAEAAMEASVHSFNDCIDCHADAGGDPHPAVLQSADCASCHPDISEQFSESPHGVLLARGDPDAPQCADCHGAHVILPASDPNSPTHPTRLPETCGKCHANETLTRSHNMLLETPVSRFQQGVHGQALSAGNFESASCNDCHDSHHALPKSDPKSLIHRSNIAATCGKCHQTALHEYERSVHGLALAAGEFDAPTCITCHGEHQILSPGDPDSPVAFANLAAQTCAPCHGLPKLNRKYGLLADPVASFENSYHGLVGSNGSGKIAANCSSCHGVHLILPSEDPDSMIAPQKLSQTCGQCHPNASESFSRSYVHAQPESFTDFLAQTIRKIYIWLIVLVIGAMILHNAIIWTFFARLKYRLLKRAQTIRRFDRWWIFQHAALALSFTLLVITGFALKHPDALWAQGLAQLGLTESARGLLHRGAALVLIAVALLHFWCLFFKKSWKGEFKSLLPRWLDVKQFVQNMRFHLGKTTERPQFGRYGYIEKLEYWGLVWGTLIMTATGLVLWFPEMATAVFPAWIVKVCEVIHYYEAWLATLAIVFYHMFFALFHPKDSPIDWTGFTGKMTDEAAKEKFPAWYRQLKDETKPPEDEK